MGWISKRYNKTGHGLAHGRKSSKRSSAPLRLIVELVRTGDNSLFGRGDLVLLECGHEVFSKGATRARCIHCAAENEKELSKPTNQ